MKWVPIQTGDLIAADVIRWKESVYGPRRSRKAKAPKLGARLVTAEVLKAPDKEGWMQLLVRKCDITLELTIKKPWPITSDTEIKRAIRTIMRGTPERLLWTDESARAAVASKFLRGTPEKG